MADEWFLMLLGLAAGFCGGLLGIGGSLVMIPALVMRGGPEKQHLYQATAMIVNFFVVAPAVWRHLKARALLPAYLWWMVPLALVGSVVGVLISELAVFRGSGQGWLQIAFAAFLLYVLYANVKRLREGRKGEDKTEAQADVSSNGPLAGVIGLATGLLGGVLGIGGGLVAVPLQQSVLKLPLRNCIANSAATILLSSVLGAILKNWHLSMHGFAVGDALRMAAYLIPTAILGAWMGASRTHKWPLVWIRLAFTVLIGYAAFRLALIGFTTATR